MDVFECIRDRRSIRKYEDRPVDWDKVVNILEAGKFAPSAGNLQNFKFIVIKEDENRRKIAEACNNQFWMEEAPIHIAVVAEPEKTKRFYGTRGERLYVIQDCAAAIENMLLAATNLGLGSCWVGAFDDDVLSRALGLPESFIPMGVVTVGYAAEKPQMPTKYMIEHVVFLEKWGQRKKIPFSSMGWWSVRTEKAVKDAAKGIMKRIHNIKTKKQP